MYCYLHDCTSTLRIWKVCLQSNNSILKFLTVSSVSSDSIVKGIIDDIIKTAVKTAEVEEQKTKYLQHLQQSCQIKQRRLDDLS
jgi:hypothetical protein